MAGIGKEQQLSAPTTPVGAASRQGSSLEPTSFLLIGRWISLAHAAWLILALAVAGIYLWALRIWTVEGNYWGSTLLDVPYAILMPTGYFVIATVIFIRKPNDMTAILTSLMLIFLGPYLLSSVNVTIGQQPGWEIVNRLLVALGGVLFWLFLFTFPDGRFPSGQVRWSALLLIGAYSFGIFFSAEVYAGFNVVFIPTAILLGISVQIYRYRRLSSPIQRQQTKWVVAGSVGPAIEILYWILLLEPGICAPPAEPLLFYVHQSIQAALALLLPIALAFSILRYRLWDIDSIISRTLVYSVLTAIIIGLYALLVGAMGALFQAQSNWLIALIATGLVAVLFQPLRERLQHRVNRLVYGHRDEPFEVLTRLGQRLENALAPELVLPTIVETIAQALKLPYAAIALQQGETLQPIESYGAPAADLHTYSLAYQGAVIGQLLVSPRSPDEPFTEEEERLLYNVAQQAGTAVHALQLTADLQHARQQIVTSREEERRRLRRDLHDGLGPSLAAQLLKIGSARALLANRPDMTDKLLAEIETDIENTLAEVRRIVYDLRPPALDQWGLVRALRAYAETCESGNSNTAALTLHVDAPDALPPLPAAVEVAAYHIAREGLTNAMRYAQARHCTLHISIDPGENSRLRLTIKDDGQGFANDVRAGVGFTAMRERAAELGGTCTIEGKPGAGVRITAVLPLKI